MITKKAKRRILKLCEHMEKLPRESARHFNMASFLEHSGDHAHPVGDVLTLRDVHSCGTTACALGYAATMPYFRKLGLKFDPKWNEVKHSHEVFDTEAEGMDFSAWSELFGEYNDDRTPKQWAKRVRKLVRQWEAA